MKILNNYLIYEIYKAISKKQCIQTTGQWAADGKLTKF